MSIKAVCENYTATFDTLEEIVFEGESNEAVNKAPGILAQMKLDKFLGLKIVQLVFSSVENVATVLQAKDINAQRACNSIQTLSTDLETLRCEETFKSIFSYVSSDATKPDFVGNPELSRNAMRRKPPAKYDDGVAPYI